MEEGGATLNRSIGAVGLEAVPPRDPLGSGTLMLAPIDPRRRKLRAKFRLWHNRGSVKSEASPWCS